MSSELILYLEPSPHSSLWTQNQRFFDASRTQPFAGNEALRYPVHCTMVGFFNKPPPAPPGTEQDPLSSSSLGLFHRFIDFLDHSIPLLSQKLQSQQPFVYLEQQLERKPAVLIQGYVRPTPDALLVALLPSDELSGFVLDLSQQFPELGLRPKRINHLSLCYWDESEILRRGATSEPEQRQRAEWTSQALILARNTIPLLSPLTTPQPQQRTDQSPTQPQPEFGLNESWDIVLYEIYNRDKSNDLPYPLQELKRWTL
ncbi:hypothetical protein BGZ83_000294 [Gryganskiella cystojenkinii]|nr:hypothetical protein BGZ83_000294 [Gryganskiella cystojenkinii]